MDSITIPDVDETLRRRLEARATLHRKSIEAEARDVLRDALGCHAPEPKLEDLYAAIRSIVELMGSVEMEIPSRESAGKPPMAE